MAHTQSDVRNTKFTPDETGGGWLEWDELVVRRGFRTRVEHRRIRKEALAAAPQPEEVL